MRKPLPIVVLLLALSASAVCRADDTEIQKFTAERPGFLKAETKLPYFSEASPLSRIANEEVTRFALQRQTKFVEDGLRTLDATGTPNAPYEYRAEGRVAHRSPTLISVEVDLYSFSGGAHGNQELFAFNYGLTDGKARPLTLGDFFERGTNYERLVSDAVLEKLKTDPKATEVAGGRVARLTRAQVNRFVVGPDGLTFVLNPYEVGPYSSGTFRVKMTVGELGPSFKKAMLAP
jgi:hypothetical protein